ncbi:MAG: tetratricopeptide repeat protein [Gammaproteobacteria bacterium]|nr:tetratricopeptide repeat protein [Gammaproteobacteria bacterium]
MENSIKKEFEQFLRQPDENIDLAEGALMVARMEYPDLDVNSYLDRIHSLADEIRNRLPENPNAGDTLTQLNRTLFDELGYEGNSEHYYDPKNSFLNDVLERKLGIPISLSILYIELGKELGLPLAGVAFPGHFLVKLEIDDGAIVLDPYFGGISLSEDDLEDRLQEFYGDKLKKSHFYGLLATSSNKDIIVRVLRNLRNLYMQNENWAKALPMADYIVSLDSDKSDALKARGAIYNELECYQAALNDFQAYLKTSPNDKAAQYIRARIMELADICRHIS